MKLELRNQSTQFHTRKTENNQKAIRAYFSVFADAYNFGESLYEQISPHAFDSSLENDIRCLTNHDTTLVLGRTKAGTFSIGVDEKGLYGEVIINENDRSAMDTYARVERGDVDQCSIGFEILKEHCETRGSNTVWVIEELNLIECSICTFPAYEETSASVRNKERQEEMKKRSIEHWKDKQLSRLNVKTGKER